MAALFSCTKCHRRYPFDELSQGEQLCKECRNNFPTVKCTYCRAEFQQNSKGSTSSICAKCAQNVKHYGKPTACENCSVLAAFIGKRCQRCVNSEKKWGPPRVCEQCKLKCAFDRPEKRKDGKLMCWLCDQAYKRVLAKTRKSGDIPGLKHSKSSSSLTVDSPNKSNTPPVKDQAFPPTHQQTFDGMTVLERLTRMATSGGSSRGNTPPVVKQDGSSTVKAEGENRLPEKEDAGEESAGNTDEKKVKDEKDRHRSHRHHHRKHHHHHKSRQHSKRRHSTSKEEDDSGDAKKQKPEKNSANGVTASAAVSTPKSTGSNEANVDTVTSENMILITQLREQIESLKKTSASKDGQLLEKDKKITELKAQMYEIDKDFRAKIQKMQLSHTGAIEALQIKNRELTRQVASLSKGKKSTTEVSTTLSLHAE